MCICCSTAWTRRWRRVTRVCPAKRPSDLPCSCCAAWSTPVRRACSVCLSCRWARAVWKWRSGLVASAASILNMIPSRRAIWTWSRAHRNRHTIVDSVGSSCVSSDARSAWSRMTWQCCVGSTRSMYWNACSGSSTRAFGVTCRLLISTAYSLCRNSTWRPSCCAMCTSCTPATG